MSDSDLGFSWRATKRGEVLIYRNGAIVTTLRGDAARAFIADAEDAPDDEVQQLAARVTGNYRRGNESLARRHPRNDRRRRSV